ncbi:MAG: type II toxin-antitoxin system Phd/YefM family antitoxin [Clostridia bacterium]|nr:MAG: type II toxin-antitoxin system Phd/YefM family antitoxin [Clostridia bacterium]
MMTINISRAKAEFLDLIRRAENNENVVIEKKGAPVAAVLSYNEYVDLKRVRDYLAMQKIYQVTKDAGITAREVYEESRRQLKTRGSGDD